MFVSEACNLLKHQTKACFWGWSPWSVIKFSNLIAFEVSIPRRDEKIISFVTIVSASLHNRLSFLSTAFSLEVPSDALPMTQWIKVGSVWLSANNRGERGARWGSGKNARKSKVYQLTLAGWWKRMVGNEILLGNVISGNPVFQKLSSFVSVAGRQRAKLPSLQPKATH